MIAHSATLSTVTTEMLPPPDGQFGDYDIESFLGKGSIGKVYLARHRRIGRRVALKTVHLEQKFEDDEDRTEFYKRLQREAELCASMQHPNVVTLYDVGYDGDTVSYLATEYVDGESLLARLRRKRPLGLVEALSIAGDLLRGLAYAHSKGIIHRDIKPANILLTSDGQAKIADFGVARPLHSSLTATRSLVGTPNYMSPEQVKTAPVSPRSDLFSAGVVMYEMLTGVKPFAAPELSAILYNIVNHAPVLASQVNPGVPESVALIVAKLLAKSANERYASASDALLDVERAIQGPVPTPLYEMETVAIPAPLDELTTPLPTIIDPVQHRPLLRRPIPPLLFWIVTLVLIASLATSIVFMRKSIARQKPVAALTREQMELPAAKKRALDDARALAQSGRYAEAVAAYDAFLDRHPQSTVARAERDETQRLLDAATPKEEITTIARKPTRREKPPEQEAQTKPEKKPSRWERVKKWFRED